MTALTPASAAVSAFFRARIMNSSPTLEIRRVLILKAERLCAEELAVTARIVFPHADIRHANTVAAARDALALASLDLLVTGLGLIDGDMLDFLFLTASRRSAIKRIMVATAREDHRTLRSLAHLPLDGLFDSRRETLAQFAEALRAVAEARGYWSRSLDCHGERPWGTTMQANESYLTPVEQLVLAVIGDGTDDVEAAARLGVKRSSVHSVRRDLHRKLGASHKGELIRLAAQRGYVRFTPNGIERPGYAMLLSSCPRRARFLTEKTGDASDAGVARSMS